MSINQTYYTVKIISSKHAKEGILGNLPKSFGYRLWSSWASMLGGVSVPGMLFGQYAGIAEAGANALGKSFTNQYTTLQTWTGNSPLEITLPIQFFAKTNANKDVHQKILKLSQILLPSLDASNKQNRFFIPPGPAPFIQAATDTSSTRVTSSVSSAVKGSLKAAVDKVIEGAGNLLAGDLASTVSDAIVVEQNVLSSATAIYNTPAAISNAKTRDNITVKIGNFMEMTSMILVGLDVNYSGQMSYDGYPMAAEVACTFRSLYTLSGNDLAAMFKSGSDSSIVSNVLSSAKSAISSIGSTVSELVGDGDVEALTPEEEEEDYQELQDEFLLM